MSTLVHVFGPRPLSQPSLSPLAAKKKTNKRPPPPSESSLSVSALAPLCSWLWRRRRRRRPRASRNAADVAPDEGGGGVGVSTTAAEGLSARPPARRDRGRAQAALERVRAKLLLVILSWLNADLSFKVPSVVV
jgi:hypothetical protein